jgi:hypothetical protein
LALIKRQGERLGQPSRQLRVAFQASALARDIPQRAIKHVRLTVEHDLGATGNPRSRDLSCKHGVLLTW